MSELTGHTMGSRPVLQAWQSSIARKLRKALSTTSLVAWSQLAPNQTIYATTRPLVVTCYIRLPLCSYCQTVLLKTKKLKHNVAHYVANNYSTFLAPLGHPRTLSGVEDFQYTPRTRSAFQSQGHGSIRGRQFWDSLPFRLQLGD